MLLLVPNHRLTVTGSGVVVGSFTRIKECRESPVVILGLFLGLQNCDPRKLEQFIRRYGPLPLCRHGYPLNGCCDSQTLSHRANDYSALAHLLADTLSVALHVSAWSSSDVQSWRTYTTGRMYVSDAIGRLAQFYETERPTTEERTRHLVVDAVDDWLSSGTVAETLYWPRRSKPERERRLDLWAYLAAGLAQRVASGHSLKPCGRCAELFEPRTADAYNRGRPPILCGICRREDPRYAQKKAKKEYRRRVAAKKAG